MDTDTRQGRFEHSLSADSELAAVVAEALRRLGTRAPAGGPEAARRRLREVLTVLSPGEIPAEAWPLLEAVWTAEARGRAVTRAEDLPRLAESGWGRRVSVWRGDITRLTVDGIVNAANAGLTGCYQPAHTCVDNAIHTAAGPWLREECGRIMESRGRPEETGTATLTGGHFLPARRVIHTVGPIVRSGAPTPGDEQALRRCYTASLAEAERAGLGSVAFCGISTGLFGYPPSLAAPAAIAAVRGLLEEGTSIDHVVFVTYSPSDQAIYTTATQEALHARIQSH